MIFNPKAKGVLKSHDGDAYEPGDEVDTSKFKSKDIEKAVKAGILVDAKPKKKKGKDK